MKLWLVQRTSESGYDDHAGFVIRASDETMARAFARQRDYDNDLWIDPVEATCIELIDEGESGVILRDFRAG